MVCFKSSRFGFSTYLSQASIGDLRRISLGRLGLVWVAQVGLFRRFSILRRSVWRIAGMGAVLLFQGWALRASADPPRSGAGPESSPPTSTSPSVGLPDQVIILDGASDLAEFWRKLDRPDLILIRPGAPGTAPSAIPSTNAASTPRTHVVSAVRIRGTVEEDLASLILEIDLTVLGSGRLWIPLGIDSPVVTAARDGEREIELRTAEPGQWEAHLEGAGPHRLRLELKVQVKATPERKHLELRIPEALSTSLELDLARPVFEVDLGPGESIGKSPLPGGRGTRLSAHLSPRSRLNLAWTDESNSVGASTPLLAAQVEIKIDADAETVKTQSSWVIRCVRGLARRLEIRLDEQDVVSQLKLDDQFMVAGIEGNVLTIPLGEPLRPRESRQLVLETKRTLSSTGPRTYGFAGFPLANAVEQFGAIGITRAANIWLNLTASQGLRRIDPRDLPDKLRALTGINFAFQFPDQPFRLGLGVENSPPRFRSETTTRLELDGETARSETLILVQPVRGRLFDLDVTVPPGLRLLSVGPPELVDSSTPTVEQEPTSRDHPPHAPGQTLKLHLTVTGRDQKALTLHLQGQQRIAPEGEVKLGLFAIRGGVSSPSSISVFADRNVSFELRDQSVARDQGLSSPALRLQPSPSSLPSPSRRSRAGVTERGAIAVFKGVENPTWLIGRVVRHPVTISKDTSVWAQVTPRVIEVRQQTSLQIQHGSVSSLTIKVSTSRPELVQIQCQEPFKRVELPRETGQPARYQLLFDPPISDASSVVFRYQVPISPALATGPAIARTIPMIVVEEGSPGNTQVELTTAPGIEATVSNEAWVPRADESETPRPSDSAGLFRLLEPGRPVSTVPFSARLRDPVALPPLVATRALLRTVQGQDMDARTHAWYWIESHSPSLAVRLPESSRLIRARIDGRTADQFESVAGGPGYRVGLPAESLSKPVLFELEYQAPGVQVGQAWAPPELEEGAEVLQTLWEVQIPSSQALVGVPSGWTDENEWYWDFYVWKRRPWRSFAKLLSWVAGSSSAAANLDEMVGDALEDSHGYLFGRSGKPVPIKPVVMSRTGIVAVCSGSVLFLGFLIMFSRIDFRWLWAAVAALGLLGASVAHPSVLLLVFQSALSGVVLTLLGLLIHRMIERGRMSEPRRAPAGAGSSLNSALGAGAGSDVHRGVGSDDSTAIRVRVPSSTMDFVPKGLTPAADPRPPESSRIGQPK